MHDLYRLPNSNMNHVRFMYNRKHTFTPLNKSPL